MSHRPGSLCGNDACPCAKPGTPCLGFEDYGSDDYDRRWCARCGWEKEDHPTADDLRNTPAGKRLMAEAWEEGAEAAWGRTGEGFNGECAFDHLADRLDQPSTTFRHYNPDTPNPYREGDE